LGIQQRRASKDPFAGLPRQPSSLHPYQYAYSNPLRWTDPSGEIAIPVFAAVVIVGGVIILSSTTAETTRSTQALVVCDTCQLRYTPWEEAIPNTFDRVSRDAPRGLRYLTGTAGATLDGAQSHTPPMDPGPPEQSVYAGPHVRSPSIEDYTVRSPLTGPEEACWVLPGPMLGAQPWPFTTGAPGEQVSGPVIFTARDFVSLRGPMPHDRPNIDNEGVNQKGQWAEEQFKEYITQQASPPWEIAGEHTHRGGIDGVYKRTSGGSLEYLVVEIKYFGRRPPSFNNKQLAPENIEKLLPDAVGAEEANTILNAGYRRMRVRVYMNGAIDVRELPGIPGRSP